MPPALPPARQKSANPLTRGDLPLREGSFRQTGRNLDIRLGSCEVTDPWPTPSAAVRRSAQGQARDSSPIDDRGRPPSGHLWRALTSIRIHFSAVKNALRSVGGRQRLRCASGSGERFRYPTPLRSIRTPPALSGPPPPSMRTPP